MSSHPVPVHCRRSRGRAAFTLIEVLVVVAIIALLVSILLPSMARARELSRRTVCATRLHNLAVAVHGYSQDNKGKLIECRYGAVQVAINPRRALPGTAVAPGEQSDYIDWWAVGKRYRLDKQLWECTNREGIFSYEGQGGPVQGYTAQELQARGYKAVTEPNNNQWILGIQYFGGIKRWITRFPPSSGKYPDDPATPENEAATWPGRSPVDSNAKPYWALAADANLMVDSPNENVWGRGRPSVFGNIPPHPEADGKPAGGNVATFDGAVTWTPRHKLQEIHSWDPSGRRAYWYQQDLGDYGLYLQQTGRDISLK